ncbi:hypothetical protein, partial [Chitinophaga qingshengii]
NCTVSDEKTVIVRTMPKAVITKDEIKQCAKGTFDIEANEPPADQKGEWSFVGADLGAKITSPNSFKTTVTGVPNGSTVQLKWTVTNINLSAC